MKRINDEQINRMVSDYLKKRNYHHVNKPKTSTNREKKESKSFCTIKELAANQVLLKDESEVSVISMSSCLTDFNTRADASYKHFITFVLHSNHSYRTQLIELQFPLFVYIFIELFQCGHKIAARQFFREHRLKFQDLPDCKLLVDSMANSINSSSLESSLKSYKSCRYSIKLSSDCWQHLNNYYKELNDVIVLQMLNNCMNIEIYQGDTHSELDLNQDFVTSTESSNKSHDESTKYKPSSMGSNDSGSLLDVIKKVRSGSPSLPSICLYSISDSNLTSVSVTNDMNTIAGGFENSCIYLWDHGPNSEESVNRKYDLRLAYRSHDIEEEEDDEEDNNNLKSNPKVSRYKIMRGHFGAVYDLIFLSNANILLSCSSDTTVRAWDFKSSQNISIFKGHMSPVWSIDTNFFENYFATGSKDGVAYLWSIERTFPLRLFCGHHTDVNCVKFHPNSNYVATGSSDKTVKLWDVQQARVMRVFSGHQGSIYSLAFSPDGKFLASAGEDRKIKLWDLNSGSLLKDYEGHTDTIYSVSFSSYDTILASCAMDQCIKLWNTQNFGDLNDTHKNDEINSSSKTQSNPLMASYKLKSNSPIYLKFMPNNLLLSISAKT